MRRIGVVSVARSDYGIYRPLLRAIHGDAEVELWLYVGGMHLAANFGLTIREIEKDGYPIRARVEMVGSDDTPSGVGKMVARGLAGFAELFGRERPDVLLVLGDRTEMLAPAVAALPWRIPVAHLHGGEASEGATDELVRHALTKLSHLHFPSLAVYADRIRQMGEDDWRIMVVGALSLDALRDFTPTPLQELCRTHGWSFTEPPLVVTFHPATQELEDTPEQLGELLGALESCGRPLLFTAPAADASGRLVLERIRRFVNSNSRAALVESLGQQGYFSLLARAPAMVGNSSSGIIEAASFHLPVVNVGSRQDGRVRAGNVIDVECRRDSIARAMQRALDPAFRRSVTSLPNPYGDGHAAERILERLKTVALDERLLRKRFVLGAPWGAGMPSTA